MAKIIYRLNKAIGFSVSDLNSTEFYSFFYCDKRLLFTEYTGIVFVIKIFTSICTKNLYSKIENGQNQFGK